MTREYIISQLNTHGDRVPLLLPRFGYRKVGEILDRGSIFEADNGDQIAVPTNPRFRDYAPALLGVLESIVSPATELDDLLTMLALPQCDIYRHRFEDPISNLGSFPLVKFSEIIPALLDFMGYTAAGVFSHRRSYTKLPPPAEIFENGCRVGQTERGSYVVKLFCPTNPLGQQPILPEGEPFGRLVTRACLENLAFLGDPDEGIYEAELPVTLNKNVASAIAKLKPNSFLPNAAAMLWFSASEGASPQTGTAQIDDRTFARAADVEKRLTNQTGLERLSLKGYIIDLHKDSPRHKASISRRVTLEVRYGESFRHATVNLLPIEYRQAVRWHDREQQVKIDALFDLRRRPMQSVELFHLESLDSRQTDLFEEG